jgi:hypothetical protein
LRAVAAIRDRYCTAVTCRTRGPSARTFRQHLQASFHVCFSMTSVEVPGGQLVQGTKPVYWPAGQKVRHDDRTCLTLSTLGAITAIRWRFISRPRLNFCCRPLCIACGSCKARPITECCLRSEPYQPISHEVSSPTVCCRAEAVTGRGCTLLAWRQQLHCFAFKCEIYFHTSLFYNCLFAVFCRAASFIC